MFETIDTFQEGESATVAGAKSDHSNDTHASTSNQTSTAPNFPEKDLHSEISNELMVSSKDTNTAVKNASEGEVFDGEDVEELSVPDSYWTASLILEDGSKVDVGNRLAKWGAASKTNEFFRG